MKTTSSSVRTPFGFTLIELLVVIAIIGILASILLPVITRIVKRSKITKAKTEMQMLTTGINNFTGNYTRFPISKASEQSAADANSDLTFGPASIGAAAPNSELVIILEDLDQAPNAGHARNPRRMPFSLGRRVTEAEAGVSTTDWIFRDPWKNPYVVTLDLNNDGKCRDAFYASNQVAQLSGNTGFDGLINPDGTPDNFLYSGPVMVWSLGPDGKADSAAKANAGANHDNVLSWK
jgi:prepilin-type N-terminal cleavage/methylation domain-containing protein